MLRSGLYIAGVRSILAACIGLLLVGIPACSIQDSRLLVALPGDGGGGSGPGSGGSGGAGGASEACPAKLVGWASVEGNGVAITTGGGDAPPQRVTSLDELRTLAADDVPRVIELVGTIATGTEPVDVTSNKTLVGVDAKATIAGGIRVENAANVIVRNLHIQGAGDGNAPADGIEVRASHHLWFDHLSIRDAPDGLLDVTSGSDFVTVSFCRFWYSDAEHSHRLACLVGAGEEDASLDTGKNNATYHHNWFADHVTQYMPRILFGQGHVYNSYYTSSGNGYAIGAGVLASVLVENNYFEDVNSPHAFQYTIPSYITARGNVYDNTEGARDEGLGGDGSVQVVPFTSPSYAYTLDDGADVPELVTRCAGPR